MERILAKSGQEHVPKYRMKGLTRSHMSAEEELDVWCYAEKSAMFNTQTAMSTHR